MDRDTYYIRAEIRDTNGKIISTLCGRKVTQIKLESVNIEPKDLEKELTNTYKNLQALMPNHQIDLDASVHNSIGDSYMVMASYYGEEKRYVKLS